MIYPCALKRTFTSVGSLPPTSAMLTEEAAVQRYIMHPVTVGKPVSKGLLLLATRTQPDRFVNAEKVQKAAVVGQMP